MSSTKKYIENLLRQRTPLVHKAQNQSEGLLIHYRSTIDQALEFFDMEMLRFTVALYRALNIQNLINVAYSMLRVVL